MAGGHPAGDAARTPVLARSPARSTDLDRLPGAMTLTGLLPVLAEDPAVTTLVDLADPARTDTGAVDVVCSEGLRRLRSFLPEGAVVGFPAWETLPHERLSPCSDTVAERLQVHCRAEPVAAGTAADAHHEARATHVAGDRLEELAGMTCEVASASAVTGAPLCTEASSTASRTA